MPTWSAPISLKGVKGDSTPQTLPNDLSANSVAIAPVSGDNTASALTQRSASGTTVFASDPSGNVTVAGTLNVGGAATLAAINGASLAVSGNETVGGNLSVTGTLTAGALTASGTNIGGNQTVQGNDTVNGTLSVAGATTLAALTASSSTVTGNSSVQGTLTAASLVVNGTLTPNGDVNVGGNVTVQKKLTVNGGTQTVGLLTASGGLSSPNNGISVVGGTTTDTLSCSGNGSISGTVGLGTTTASALTTTGNLRSNGNFTVATGTSALGGPVNATSTLSVTGATTLAGLTASSSSITGNESVGGTLAVTGATTLGSVTASSASVTGSTSLAGVTASGTVTAANVTLSSGGKITFADGSTQAQASAAAIDPSFNSVIVAPVSGNQTASSLKLNNSGGTTLFSVDGSGNAVVGGTLKATGASTMAAVTAGSASTTGNASVGGTLSVTGTSTLAAANATNVAASGTLNVTGTSTLAGANATNVSASGTLSVTGTSTLAAVNATNVSASGTLSVTGQTNLGTLNAVNSTATVKNLTLTSGGGGQLTFADGTTQATAAAGATATGSRTILNLGGNASSNQAANSLWTYELTQTDEGSSNAASSRPNPGQMKYPFPFTVTGWALQQYQARGTQTFQIVKNRNGSSLGSIVTVNAGNATVTGFPGNAFSGTFTKGTYNFAAGDTIGAVGQNSSAGASDVQLQLMIEWT